MNCPSKTKHGAGTLVGYAAGDLDPALAAEFEKHMESCGECRQAAEAQREVWRALDGWTPAAVSPDFDARLYARIAAEQSAPGWGKWARGIFHPAVPYPLWKPVALAAAGVMVAVGLVATGFLARTPAPPNSSPQLDAADRIDIQQVAHTLDVLDMLTPPPGS